MVICLAINWEVGVPSANHISQYVLLGQDDVLNEGLPSGFVLGCGFLWLCAVVSILLTWEKRKRKLLTCSHRFVVNIPCVRHWVTVPVVEVLK